LINCQTDTDPQISHEPEIIESSNKSNERLSFEQISDDPIFFELAKQFNTEKMYDINNYAKSSLNKIIVITDTISVIKKKNYTSYTFLIRTQEQDPSEIKNLVLEMKNDTSNAFILTYKFSPEWIKNYINGIHGAPEGTVSMESYPYNNLGKNQTTKTQSCSRVDVTFRIPCGCGHYFSWDCEGCRTASPYSPSSYTTSQRVCVDGDGTGLNTTNYTDPGGVNTSSGGGGSPTTGDNTDSENRYDDGNHQRAH